MYKTLALTILTITTASAESVLKVSLYYETLCPDSVAFVTEQLYPAYLSLSDHLNIDFVPYGFAQASNQTGSWTFVCQHGPGECHGNQVHSCVIALNPVSNSVEFINCAESDDSSDDTVLQQCAEKSGVSWNSIQECLDSGLAAELLVENGRRTAAVKPAINYVPTVIFNDVYNQTLQDLGEHHFFDTVCVLLENEPSACSQTN